jgi:hypothetical protein
MLMPARLVAKGDKIQYGLGFFLVTDTDWNGASDLYITIATSAGVRNLRIDLPCQVLRPSYCENPCCENCCREVGEDRYICKAHWNAWEQSEALDQRMEIA